MPYIKESREYFNENPKEAKTPGDLTYVLYREMLRYWQAAPSFKTYFELRRGQIDARLYPKTLQDLCIGLSKAGVLIPDIITAYNCALDEIKRRYVNDYEDVKLKENGEVVL